ncbi:NAD/NADP-dependent indole-3-acetaldehyde reductase [Paramyrothecium foliicola]|nr:NAD/NADP-dependent indole-3-acetaldehyde reductase [Paramyrothecium foliicola]
METSMSPLDGSCPHSSFMNPTNLECRHSEQPYDSHVVLVKSFNVIASRTPGIFSPLTVRSRTSEQAHNKAIANLVTRFRPSTRPAVAFCVSQTHWPLLASTAPPWFKDVGDGTLNQNLIDLTKAAIQKGFHHLDCAETYGTEEEVGLAIKDAGVPREKLYITNKVAQGIDDIPAAMEQSLQKMQIEYKDLYLIHVPFFAKSEADFQRAWKSMEELQRLGKAKSIGVSNYLREDVEATLRGATVQPALNQIEFHAYLQHGDDYVPWMRQQGIQVGSFKGLTPAFRAPDGPLRQPLACIARAHDATEAAVLISWIIRNNIIAVTTTTKVERLDEYAQALKINMTEEEVQEITDLGSTYHFRTGWPEHFEENDRP